MSIVNMASRTLKGPEKNYFTSEIKLLAIIRALAKFRSYLVGAEVRVRSDHKSLSFLRTCRFLNGRLTRCVFSI